MHFLLHFLLFFTSADYTDRSVGFAMRLDLSYNKLEADGPTSLEPRRGRGFQGCQLLDVCACG